MNTTYQLRHLTREQVSNYFLKEAAKSCPANLKFAWMNQYIQNGGAIPNKETLNKPLNFPLLLQENRVREMKKYSMRVSAIDELAENTLKRIEKKESDQRVVIDLGGGNSSLALGLLEKNWKVYVVEPSAEALYLLQRRVHLQGLGSLAEKNLILVPQKMEDFSFPENVDFIYAQSSLPYCDASKVTNVWDKIHRSLKVGGYFAGDLFNSCSYSDPISDSDLELTAILDDDTPDPKKEIVTRVQLGAWMTSPSVAYSLIKNSHYELDYFAISDTSIDFIGRKNSD